MLWSKRTQTIQYKHSENGTENSLIYTTDKDVDCCY